jgi:hypothetical protein
MGMIVKRQAYGEDGVRSEPFFFDRVYKVSASSGRDDANTIDVFKSMCNAKHSLPLDRRLPITACSDGCRIVELNLL